MGNNRFTGSYYKKALDTYQQFYKSEVSADIGIANFVMGSFLEQIMKLEPAAHYYQQALNVMSALGDDYQDDVDSIQLRLQEVLKKKEKWKK